MKQVRLLFGVGTLALLWPSGAFGQARPAALQFDVVSVKPTPKERLHSGEGLACTKGRFLSTGFPLSFVVRWSYRMSDALILGLPEWARDWELGYDIEAKSGEAVSQDECRLMVRSLLEDRFRMTAHLETREMRGYALVVGKDGSKLQEPGGAEAKINGQTVADSADTMGLSMRRLAGILTDHPAVGMSVVDSTGLAGTYSFNLTFSTREGDDLPSIFTALSEQLGLKLEARKLPIPVLIVDHIEQAAPN